MTVHPFSAVVCPGGKSPALAFTRLPATWSVGSHPLLVHLVLSAMRNRPGHGIGWWAPIVGVSGVVRNAEFGPVPGCCGCVVGRVVEVEFIGVRGRTRRSVLDFRPTVGVMVAACAGPATYMGPLGRSRPAGWFHPRVSWVCTNGGCVCGCPQCGVRPGCLDHVFSNGVVSFG